MYLNIFSKVLNISSTAIWSNTSSNIWGFLNLSPTSSECFVICCGFTNSAVCYSSIFLSCWILRASCLGIPFPYLLSPLPLTMATILVCEIIVIRISQYHSWNMLRVIQKNKTYWCSYAFLYSEIVCLDNLRNYKNHALISIFVTPPLH